MIQCARCGKIYDYEKYNGICPKCARYNRRDSSAMEHELHEKYDSYEPHYMNSDAQIHKRNGDVHQARSNYNGEKSYRNAGAKGIRKSAVILSVIITILCICVALWILFHEILVDSVGDDDSGWGYTDTESVEDGDWTSIECIWATSDDDDADAQCVIDTVNLVPLETDFSDVDINDYSWNYWNQVEAKELGKLTAPEGTKFALISLEIWPDENSLLDLSEVSFWVEDTDSLEEFPIVMINGAEGIVGDDEDADYYSVSVELIVEIPDDTEDLYFTVSGTYENMAQDNISVTSGIDAIYYY